jgi:hypothetical protein
MNQKKRERFKNLQSEVVTNTKIKEEIRERTKNSGEYYQLVCGNKSNYFNILTWI